jgi:O-antigen/teichoic acid export membrane protein
LVQFVAFLLPFALYGAIGGNAQVTPTLVISGGLAFVIADFYALQLFVLRAEDRARFYAICEAGSNIARVAVTIGLLESGFGTGSVLFGAWIAGSVVGIGLALPIVNRILSRELVLRARYHDLRKELLTPAVRAVPLGVGSWINDVSDRVILMHFEGQGAVGVYSANYALGSRLVTALSQPVNTLMWPRILQASVKKDEEAVAREIALGFRAYMWLASLPTAVLCLHPSWVTAVVLGPQYRSANVVVALVAVGTFFQGATTYVSRGIEISGRYGFMSLATLAASALNIAGNLILVPIIGLAGAAAATTVTYIGLFVFYVIWERRTLVFIRSRVYLPPVVVAVAAVYLGQLSSTRGSWLTAATLLGIYGAAAAATLWRLSAIRNQVS